MNQNQLSEIKITAVSYKTFADSELVDLVRLGETRAFDEIDNRYRTALQRFLLRITSNSELAEELTQRALVRAFEMIDQLKSGAKLIGWLYRIAFRLAVTESRSRKVASLEEVVEPFWAPVDRVDIEDERRSIWDGVKRRLSPEEYEILLFRYRDDLTLSEVAERTGKSEGHVRVQLHRARKKLRGFL
ncbi:MAG: sigma-70 family RNA polymerase sigma factor [Planctomycetaceae bacterium]|jgi:RNA polymerase sigma-70 factor (ECF subfamily)|nr:sigma-70 family RNA polymerase sigma factor [Planctomycetaceae bacterium]